MTTREARKRAERREREQTAPPLYTRPWFPYALLTLAVLVFYWIPLTDRNTTPQWDAIDVHYSRQKYFSDEVRDGSLPQWAEY